MSTVTIICGFSIGIINCEIGVRAAIIIVKVAVKISFIVDVIVGVSIGLLAHACSN